MNIFFDETENIAQSFDKCALKFIHFQSIKNFIFRFNDIRNENDKIKIKKLLEEYFREVNAINGLVTDDCSKELFIHFISIIGKYYRDHFGFIRKTRKSGIALFIVIDLILFSILKAAFQIHYYIPVLSIFVIFSYFDGIFRLKNKLYGYRY